MARRVLILADDLTGAADSAVAFADRGAVVAFDTRDHVRNTNVVAFDLNTRSLTSEAAIAATLQALQFVVGDAQDLLFKKVDSALRGNVAHELAATLAWRRRASADGKHVFAILAPAFPAQHRITRGGCQLHHGQPLHFSELWQRERNVPARTLAELLAHADLSSACIPLDVVRSAENILIGAMTTPESLPDVFICDAETDAELHAVAQAALHLDAYPILVGTAGLARQLALATRVGTSSSIAETRRLNGPILIVLGTMAPASHRQVEALLHYAELTRINVPVADLLDECSRAHHKASMALSEQLGQGNDVLLLAGGGEYLGDTASRKLPRELGNLLRPFGNHVGALVATGGETARAILEAWGVSKLKLFAEVEDGVPCCRTQDWHHTLTVITKSGGFGHAETLSHAYDFLLKQRTAV